MCHLHSCQQWSSQIFLSAEASCDLLFIWVPCSLYFSKNINYIWKYNIKQFLLKTNWRSKTSVKPNARCILKNIFDIFYCFNPLQLYSGGMKHSSSFRNRWFCKKYFMALRLRWCPLDRSGDSSTWSPLPGLSMIGGFFVQILSDASKSAKKSL